MIKNGTNSAGGGEKGILQLQLVEVELKVAILYTVK